MSRRPASAIEASAAALAAQVGISKPRPRGGMSKHSVERIVGETVEMLAKNDWSGARPGHLVALWASCHEHVYGVRPEEELKPAQFSKACVRAGKILKESFGGDPTRAVAFISWTWSRERGKSGKTDRRIGWGLQFSSYLVGDWRVATAGRTR